MNFLELKWAYGCPFDCAWCYLKGTFRFLETKTKPVFKDRKKVRMHTEAFFITYQKEVLNTGEIADHDSSFICIPFCFEIFPALRDNS